MKVITGGNTQAIVEPKLRNLHLNQRNRKVPFSTQTIEFKLSPFASLIHICAKVRKGTQRKKQKSEFTAKEQCITKLPIIANTKSQANALTLSQHQKGNANIIFELISLWQ